MPDALPEARGGTGLHLGGCGGKAKLLPDGEGPGVARSRLSDALSCP